MSSILAKLNMPVSLKDFLKLTSINSKAMKLMGIQLKTTVPKPLPILVKDPPIMI